MLSRLLFLSVAPAAAFLAGAPRVLSAPRSSIAPNMLVTGPGARSSSCRGAPPLLQESHPRRRWTASLTRAFALAVDAASAITLLNEPTQLLAMKSGTEELLEEFFLNFPTIISGTVFAFFVVQYVQNLKPLKTELPGNLPLPVLPTSAELPDYWQLVAVPSIAVGIVILGKVGFLGWASGVLAKGMLDGWNVFANAALPGAILKY